MSEVMIFAMGSQFLVFAAQDLANLSQAPMTPGPLSQFLTMGGHAANETWLEFPDLQNISNVGQVLAVADCLDVLLRGTAPWEVAAWAALYDVRAPTVQPVDFAVNMSGVVWALKYAGMLHDHLHAQVRNCVLNIGRELDRRMPSSTQGAISCGWTHPTLPHVELDLIDRLILHKPPGWEVDTTDVGNAKHLSRFLRVVLSCRITNDPDHSYGFLHRLDTPSSGLIIVAKTYAAYYDLKMQLGVGDLVRDYIVLCHGLMPPSCTEIDAKVYHWRHEGNLPSTVCRKGKPSRTNLKVLAYCTRGEENFSLVAIRIQTGRRHQIRTHACHVGHPTVCDGKYTSATTFLRDREWCERNFLHRYRLAFSGLDGTQCEAVAPLPGDLVEALRHLTPCTLTSAQIMKDISTGHKLLDWALFEVLDDATVGSKS